MNSPKSSRNELDPLDKEILEQALDACLSTRKADVQSLGDESDEALERALRLELLEIARFNGICDPEALKDILQRTQWPTAEDAQASD